MHFDRLRRHNPNFDLSKEQDVMVRRRPATARPARPRPRPRTRTPAD